VEQSWTPEKAGDGADAGGAPYGASAARGAALASKVWPQLVQNRLPGSLVFLQDVQNIRQHYSRYNQRVNFPWVRSLGVVLWPSADMSL
jgi:hypothetical protein